jgi:hydroxymethylpyrimidine pyrophosphatase-like HAD family hydrolase
MRYTALAVDYDGTIAHDGVVPPHVIDGLERLKATGRRLLLVTGRELPELKTVFPQVGIFDRVVAENGALLYRPASGEEEGLGDAPPQGFIEMLRSRGVPLSVGRSIVATVTPHEATVLDVIRELGLERQVIFNKGAVMVLPAGVNKASGLAVALAELSLSARNVVACGDGENDHALLDSSEYSVAVANAIQSLKDRADRVTMDKRGDGVLEVIAELIENDLARAQPARPRRVVVVGQDAAGENVSVPAAGVSMLVTGGPRSGKSTFVIRQLERLAACGYQYCVIDTRGEYLQFNPAVVFGTAERAPDPTEALTALQKPGVHAVVCLVAIERARRTAFVADLMRRLVALREETGRPHWIVLDEAQEVPEGRSVRNELADEPAENLIHVTSDPERLGIDMLVEADVVVGRGPAAHEMLATVAARLDLAPPAEPEHSPREGEALVWFRRTRGAPLLVELPRRDAMKTRESEQVGRLLRRA